MTDKSPPWQEEWELLPSNTSFLEFGLEDIKDLISTEIDYMDYLREEHLLKLTQDKQENERKKPAPELTASNNQAPNKRLTAAAKEFVSCKAEDPKQICTEEISRGSGLKDKGSATDKEKENSAERPCYKRGLAASIGMLCSLAAAAATAACVVMLGGGLQHQQRRRGENLRFQLYGDNKGLMGLNQALVAMGREPPPAMRTATISFGGFFDGL